MRVTGVRSFPRLTRILGLAVITALVPLPLIADDTGGAKRTPTIRESAARIVPRDISAAPAPTSRAREARQGSTSTASTSFFKTRPGMIALAVIAVGTGYAIYSAQHDRIRSPGRN